MTTICAFLLIVNTSPFPRLFEDLDSVSPGLFTKLLVSENVFTARDMTGVFESETLSVKNKTDNVLVSSTATCNINEKCESVKLINLKFPINNQHKLKVLSLKKKTIQMTLTRPDSNPTASLDPKSANCRVHTGELRRENTAVQ